ncbi:MAG: peptidase dimerization domain-containing protein, partial [Nanoarchaeota archaeon]
AIDEIIVLLSKLKLLELPEDSELGKTTLNIGTINGGIKPNIIPDNADAEVVLRISRNSGEVMEIIEKAVPAKNIAELKCIEPVVCRDSSFDFLDLQKVTVPFFSEMAFWAKKSKVIIFGPGDIKLAHSDDEKIRKKDIEKAKGIFLEMIRKLTS